MKPFWIWSRRWEFIYNSILQISAWFWSFYNPLQSNYLLIQLFASFINIWGSTSGGSWYFLMWLLQLAFKLNLAGQWVHWKGFSPVWVRKCLLISAGRLRIIPHMEQAHLAGPTWTGSGWALFCNKMKRHFNKMLKVVIKDFLQIWRGCSGASSVELRNW